MADEMGSSNTDSYISQLVALMESVSQKFQNLRHAQQSSTEHKENERFEDEMDEILSILQSDISVLERLDHSGRGVLHYMISLHFPGRMDMLNRMRSMSTFNVNIRDFESRTPLHYALNNDNLKCFAKMGKHKGQQHSCGSLLDIVKFLLDCGADVDALDKSGDHPLHLALDHVSNTRQPGFLEDIPEIVRLLMSSSTLLKPFNLAKQGRHLVFFVCMLQGPYALPIMKSLINRENVEKCSSIGVPLLVLIISNSKDDDSVVEKASFLLSLGADVNLCDVEGLSPLSCAFDVREPLIEPLVLLLLDHGAKIVDSISDDTTFFHKACKTRLFNIFKNLPLFLKTGANIYSSDLRGSLALHKVICRITKKEEFDCLVLSGVDVTRIDEAENNALHHLHVSPSNDVLKMLGKLLIAHGCSVNHENERGETPLLCFLQCHRNQNLGYIQTLIDLGASVNCQNHEGIAPLHIASRILRKDNMEIPINMLLNAGADVNLLDDQMNSALHYALRDGQTVDAASISKLLAAGCDPNIPNHIGVTPLHVACFSMAEGAVEILLDYGADINAQDDSGATPLHFLVSNKNVLSSTFFDRVYNIIRLLISRHADLTIKNDSGHSPFATCIVSDGSLNYLAQYVAVLVTAGKYVMNDLENELLKESPRFHDDFKTCINCARIMKTCYLGDSSITLLDFSIMNDMDAARILRNTSIEEVLTGNLKITENFPGYQKFFASKISRCQSLERILSSAERVVSNFCFERPLPTVATDNIIRLLNERDLNALSDSISK